MAAFRHRRIRIALQTKVCDNLLSRTRGLMFTRRNNNLALVFCFEKKQKLSFHMVFVFYPIDVLFLDEHRRVVEMKKGFKPFSIYRTTNECKYAIELPSGYIDNTGIKLGDEIDFDRPKRQ